jgi:hypothetical protein
LVRGGVSSILPEIYLCHAHSCHEILSGNAAAGRYGFSGDAVKPRRAVKLETASDAAADGHRQQVGGDATVMKTEGYYYYYSAASAVSQSERQLSVNLAKKFGDHAAGRAAAEGPGAGAPQVVMARARRSSASAHSRHPQPQPTSADTTEQQQQQQQQQQPPPACQRRDLVAPLGQPARQPASFS